MDPRQHLPRHAGQPVRRQRRQRRVGEAVAGAAGTEHGIAAELGMPLPLDPEGAEIGAVVGGAGRRRRHPRPLAQPGEVGTVDLRVALPRQHREMGNPQRRPQALGRAGMHLVRQRFPQRMVLQRPIGGGERGVHGSGHCGGIHVVFHRCRFRSAGNGVRQIIRFAGGRLATSGRASTSRMADHLTIIYG